MENKKNFYIDGKWVAPNSKEEIKVINPATEEKVGHVVSGSEIDVNEAVSAAKQAFLAASLLSLEQKKTILQEIIDGMDERREEFAQVISQEMGAPITLSQKAQAPSGLGHFINTLNALKQFQFEDLSDSYIVRKEPVGVCGLITPWNWPINQIALKVVPALATGCTMILKPSEIAPLSGMLFAEMIHEAGFPPGVFNLVNGDGAGVGTILSGHKDVDMVSFTGSTRAGRLITKNAADTIKRVCLELGGKGGNIVFADSYPDAVRDGIRNVMSNSGQSCECLLYTSPSPRDS